MQLTHFKIWALDSAQPRLRGREETTERALIFCQAPTPVIFFCDRLLDKNVKNSKILQFLALYWNPIQCHIPSASSAVQLSWASNALKARRAETFKVPPPWDSMDCMQRLFSAIQSIHIPRKCNVAREERRRDPSWGWQGNVPPFHLPSSHPRSGYQAHCLKYYINHT